LSILEELEMSDPKRFVVKIYDRELGSEYEFDADSFDHDSEQGIEFKRSPEGYPLDLAANGQVRHCFKIWSGFEKWEDFETDVTEEKTNA
jgi:hypothetical protein